MSDEVCEELVAFACGELRLSGVLSYPERSAPTYAVLICAPHPNFAGNMENNVVVALARAFASRAMTLRFDYRGIGASEIRLPSETSVFDYWDALEAKWNYADPLADIAAAAASLNAYSHGLPLVIVGYSFGAIVGLMSGLKLAGVRAMAGVAPPLKMYPFDFLAGCKTPCALISGDGDFVFSADESARLRSLWSAQVRQTVLPDEDHFFRGTEGAVCAQVRAFVEQGLKL